MIESEIHIVGYSGIFPGANEPEQLWENLLERRAEFRLLPTSRFDLNEYLSWASNDRKNLIGRYASLITGWDFKFKNFNIPFSDRNVSDTAHWLALDAALKAIEHSKIELSSIDLSRVGVIIGNSLTGEYSRSINLRNRWPYFYRAIKKTLKNVTEIDQSTLEKILTEISYESVCRLPEICEDSLPGAMSNTIAGRICGYFGFKGGGYTIDGACSSSLLAIVNGCEALRRNELDYVICGGVDISIDPFEVLGFSALGVLSDEFLYPYSDNRKGMVPGEGCGMFILTSKNMLNKNSLNSYAKIKGWGIASDGGSNLTEPLVDGQLLAIEKAYSHANLDIREVEYIEGHGTGTIVGDEIELKAIATYLKRIGIPNKPIKIGSIKGNIGHIKAAAGSAGVLKAILSLNKGVIAPTTSGSESYDLFNSYSNLLAPINEPIPFSNKHENNIGISAFGFGGSNAHLIIGKEKNQIKNKLKVNCSFRNLNHSEIFLIQTVDIKSLYKKILALKELALKITVSELTDLSYQLTKQILLGSCRLAIFVDTPHALSTTCDKVLKLLSNSKIYNKKIIKGDFFRLNINVDQTEKRPIAFVFPGQGMTSMGMSRYFYQTFSESRNFLNSLKQIDNKSGFNWEKLINYIVNTSINIGKEDIDEVLSNTQYIQSSIVADSLSVALSLKSIGITPDVVLGHSLGEISAMAIAGGMGLEDAVELASFRGRAILDKGSDGGMVVILESEKIVKKLLNIFKDIYVANINSSTQIVVSGERDVLSDLLEYCKLYKIHYKILNSKYPFHTKLLSKAKYEFANQIKSFKFKNTRLPFISSLSGKHEKIKIDSIIQYLQNQLTSPVLWSDAMRILEETYKPELIIECGYGSVLTNINLDLNFCKSSEILGLGNSNDVIDKNMNEILATYWINGREVDLEPLYSYRNIRHFEISTYDANIKPNPCEWNDNDCIQESVEKIENNDFCHDFKNLEVFIKKCLVRKLGGELTSFNTFDKLRSNIGLDSIKYVELITEVGKYTGRSDWPNIGWKDLSIRELAEIAINGDLSAVFSDLNSLFKAVDSHVGIYKFSLKSDPLIDAYEKEIIGERIDTFLSFNQEYEDQLMDKLALIDYSNLMTQSMPPDLGVVILHIINQKSSISLKEEISNVKELGWKIIELCRWLSNSRTKLIIVEYCNNSIEGGLGTPSHSILASANKENVNFFAKWLCLPITEPWANLEDIISKEMHDFDESSLIFYDNSLMRLKSKFRPKGFQKNHNRVFPKNNVIIASGAAKGITLRLSIQLAILTGASLAVIGRSSINDVDVKAGMAEIQEKGIMVKYYSCDVSDHEEVNQSIKSICSDLGEPTVLLHGAGINVVESIFNLEELDYSEVFNIKTIGLINLWNACKIYKLNTVVTINSVISYVGMKGQSAYGFSNATMSWVMKLLERDNPNIKFLDIAYSVWENIGMGKNMGLESSLKQQGVALTSINQGESTFSEIVSSSIDSSSFLVTGRLGKEFEQALFGPFNFPKSRYLKKVSTWLPHNEIGVDFSLSVENDSYLVDHKINGAMIWPGALVIDAFYTVGSILLNSDQFGNIVLKNVKFEYPIVINDSDSLDIHIHGFRGYDVDDVIQLDLSFRSQSGWIRACSGELCLDDNIKLEKKDLSGYLNTGLENNFQKSNILFQGAFFDHIKEVLFIDENLCLCELEVPNSQSYFRSYSDSLITFYPSLRDAFFQVGLLLCDKLHLPVGIEKLQINERLLSGDDCYCLVETENDSGKNKKLNITVMNNEGFIVEKICGLVVKAINSEELMKY